MRALASIQRIIALAPIEGAEAIETATVLGWQVVVKKHEFKPGDLVVYVEIDSVLPARPEFDFLKSKNYRIKTIRLRGQVSQGICFPLSVLPDSVDIGEGLDVTNILEIKHIDEIQPPTMPNAKGNFPSFVPKTEEPRLQTFKNLDKIKKYVYIVTEKLDGMSATYYLKDGVFGVCSRNLELKEDETSAYWRVAKMHGMEKALHIVAEYLDIKNVAIQGEIIGAGINGNRYNKAGIEFYAFSVFDIDKYKYVPEANAVFSFLSEIGIRTVPVLGNGIHITANTTREAVQKLSEIYLNGHSVIADVIPEGIVLRNVGQRKERISFKVINEAYLLEHNL